MLEVQNFTLCEYVILLLLSEHIAYYLPVTVTIIQVP
jgi:hypothetical protein